MLWRFSKQSKLLPARAQHVQVRESDLSGSNQREQVIHGFVQQRSQAAYSADKQQTLAHAMRASLSAADQALWAPRVLGLGRVAALLCSTAIKNVFFHTQLAGMFARFKLTRGSSTMPIRLSPCSCHVVYDILPYSAADGMHLLPAKCSPCIVGIVRRQMHGSGSNSIEQQTIWALMGGLGTFDEASISTVSSADSESKIIYSRFSSAIICQGTFRKRVA
jgi:hypothetical protein